MYLNEARTSPIKFSQYVSKEIEQFINSTYLPLTSALKYKTHEGVKAWKEILNFLKSQPSLSPYKINEGLSLAAEDHAIDMAVNNFFGHKSSNGKSLSDRITNRCGPATGYSAENIGMDFKI